MNKYALTVRGPTGWLAWEVDGPLPVPLVFLGSLDKVNSETILF